MPILTIYPWSMFSLTGPLTPAELGTVDAASEVGNWVGTSFHVTDGTPQTLLLQQKPSDDTDGPSLAAGQALDQAIMIDGKSYPAGTPVSVSGQVVSLSGSTAALIRIGDRQVGLAFHDTECPAPGDGLTISEMHSDMATLMAETLPELAAHQGILCFATGTQITTPGGPRRVETLRPGEMVSTSSHGPKPVIWTGRREVLFARGEDPRRPILFRPGSLGPDLPRRDLVLSPDHRIALRGPDVRTRFDADEVLAPAEGLIELRGCRRMRGKRRVTYVHLMLDHHGLIFAEGAASESFYPSPAALATLTDSQRKTVFGHVPSLRHAPEDGFGSEALPSISLGEAQALARVIKTRGGPDALSDGLSELRIVAG